MSEDEEREAPTGGGWIGYRANQHGFPNRDGNDHLSPEQRRDLEQKATERAAARGPLQARIVVEVYENGEAVPQVGFPKESTLGLHDRVGINAAVACAAEALNNWR